MTYEEAIKKLETLVGEMEQGEVPIDKMAERLREAQQLILQCRKQLKAADEAIGQLLDSPTE